MNTSVTSFGLFLLGLFSETQIRVVGSIGISELFVFVIAPFVFIRDYRELKYDKFMWALLWAVSAMIGCVISCWYNGTPFGGALRGFATAYSVFAIPVVLHGFLRNNIMGFRWMLLGMAISSIITIFVFYNTTELTINAGGQASANTTSELMSGQLFWLSHFGALPVLPVQGWYLASPMPYAIVAPIIITGYTILVSATGRSSVLTALLASILIFLGGKSRSRLVKLQKNIVFVGIICIVFLGLISSLYKYAGRSGLLNEQARQKYEYQVERNIDEKGFSPLKMLMAGRIDFFVGLYECLLSPIMGYGPWAIDMDGIYEDFLRKYGNREDYDNYVQRQMYLANTYRIRRYALIGGHSYILQFWLAYGILGLPYWIYIIYLTFQFYKRYISFFPQFYGYFVIFSTSFFWNVFFSPFSARMGYGLFVTMVLLIRAAVMGSVSIPMKELMKARQYDG